MGAGLERVGDGAPLRHDATIVKRAIDNGKLAADLLDGRLYVTRTDATRWRARRCPSGEGSKSWISLSTAARTYLFTNQELRDLIESKGLRSKIGMEGSMRGVVYVLRHQCGQLRERVGFTLPAAAKRAGVPVARIRALLDGARWRQEDARIPLEAVKTVIKRIQSAPGLTTAEAAAERGVESAWVLARVDDGTIRLTVDKWASNETRVTPPMMMRLRRAIESPLCVERLDPGAWCGLVEAMSETGVTAVTPAKWADEGEVERRMFKGRWRYRRATLRERSMRYWSTSRFKRAPRPEWLKEEQRNLA